MVYLAFEQRMGGGRCGLTTHDTCCNVGIGRAMNERLSRVERARTRLAAFEIGGVEAFSIQEPLAKSALLP